MLTRRSAVLLSAVPLLNSVANAEPNPAGVSEITLHPSNQDSPQAVTEFATVLRTIGDIRDVLVSNEGKDVTVRGTAGQLAFSQWLFNEFQHPTPVMPGSARVTHSFEINDPRDPAVRTCFLEPRETPASITEYVTMLRMVLDVRRAYTYPARNAMALRGTVEQAEASDWILRCTDPASKTHPASLEFKLRSPDDIVGLYFRSNDTPAHIQQISTQIRRDGRVLRLFIHQSHQFVAVRGNAEQIALASRLFQ